MNILFESDRRLILPTGAGVSVSMRYDPPVNTKRVKNTVGFFLITRNSLMPGGVDNAEHLTTQDDLKWL